VVAANVVLTKAAQEHQITVAMILAVATTGFLFIVVTKMVRARKTTYGVI
jgi:hypothetical protein